MLLVPIPYNNFVISVNLQSLSLVKVILLTIHRFQNQYSTLIILPKSYSLYRHSFKISYHLSSPFYATLSSATPLSSGSIFT
ncbi:hypothetical protein BDR04DRAFT_1094907 [Suillus decipiens]|nr:hypothetical protein BDR04DRAFT_1094907 [Suillus decipiens]